MQQLHYAHQGAEKCKLRAKGSVLWANINENMLVKGCPPCQCHQSLNVKEPLLLHDVPGRLGILHVLIFSSGTIPITC